jgi:putative flippase GtrA
MSQDPSSLPLPIASVCWPVHWSEQLSSSHCKMSRAERILLYAACAVAATLLNLVVQWSAFYFYHGTGELVVGMIAGTAAGLGSKYALDKYLIFDDRSLQLADNLRKISYYILTGVFTTAIFWGTEAIFALSDQEAMRYLGAVVGLSIGYFMKFQLDRRFVFRAPI